MATAKPKITQVDIDAGRAPVGTLGMTKGTTQYKKAVAASKTKTRTAGTQQGTLAQQIQQAIAVAQANQNAPQPIGINPNQVIYPRQQEGQGIAGHYGTLATVPPKYYDGMETGAGVFGFPQTTAGIAQLQQSLVAAQLLKKGTYAPGQWDVALSAKAFAQLLGDANINGYDWQTALSNRLTAASKGELLATAAHRNPLVVKLTNPEDIAAAAQQATKTLHNTFMTPQELANFTKAYQQQEAAFQTATYEATGFNPLSGQQDTALDAEGNPVAGAGATLVAPPTGAGLENAITKKTIALHPNEFAANTFTDRMDEILHGLVQGPGNTPSSAVNPGGL